LDVSKEIKLLLEKIMPMRNNPTFNANILKLALSRSNNFLNESVRTQEDMMRFARTFKNDFNTYLLHNMLSKSAEGEAFFKEQFSTTKSYTEYMKELVATPKLINLINEIKALPDYAEIYSQYPILKFIIEQGASNKKLINFKFLENGMNSLEKNSMIAQFETLVNLQDTRFTKVKELFRDLALYSTFQSGMNTSDNSYTDVTPIELINKLYGFGVTEFMKLSSQDKLTEYDKFNKLFIKNNPGFEVSRKLNDTPTKDVAKMGKWYSATPLFEKQKEVIPTTPVPTGKKATIKVMGDNIKGDTTATKNAAIRREGIYSMRPTSKDKIPGLTETQNFGNPWSERGFSEIKAASIAESVGNYKKWLLGEDFKDVQPKKREWIINMINSGRLDGKPFLYFKGGYISHAHVLVDIINNRKKYNLVAKPTIQESTNEEKVSKYRAQEQKELAARIPNIEKYKVDGKVDDKLITDPTDLKTYNEIYDKYDVLITPLLPKSSTSVVEKQTINTKIDNWIDENLPSLVSMSTEDIIKMYETDKKSGETIEDFLHRMTCNGKLI
jgi:hypothetical protein